MSESRSQWLLKVIAGPHQGAEVELASGKSLIGSDEGCDVVLHDVLIAPQHLAVDAGAKALFVEPLGGRVYVSGKRVKDTRQKVEPFTFITLGGTHLVIGPVDGKWPLLSAGDVPELEKEAPEPEAAEEAKTGEAAATTQAGAATAATSGPESGAASPPPKRAVALFGVGFGLLLLTAWLILFNLWKSNQENPAGGDKDDLKTRAEEVLKFHKADSVVKVEAEGGRLFARGYVERSDQRRLIEQDLRSQASGVFPRIWSLEDLAESARSILRLQGLPLKVTVTPEGRLAISGTTENRDLWNRVKQKLADEIPGVTGVDSQVTVPAIVRPSERTVIVTLPGDVQRQGPGADDATGGALSAEAEAGSVGGTMPGQAASPDMISSQSGGAIESVAVASAGQDPAQAGAVNRGSGFASAPGSLGRSSAQGSGAGGVAAPPPREVIVRQPQELRPLFPTIDKPDATIEIIQARPGGLGSMRLSSGGIYFAGGRLPYGGVVRAVEEERVLIEEAGVERAVRMGEMVRLAGTPGASNAASMNLSTVAEALSSPPAPPAASGGGAVSGTPPEEIRKPEPTERQKAIQEALEAAVATESALPVNETTTSRTTPDQTQKSP